MAYVNVMLPEMRLSKQQMQMELGVSDKQLQEATQHA